MADVAALGQAETALWQFLNTAERGPIKPCQWLLALGCADTRVAQHCAQLYHQGLAKQLMFSGGFGRITRTKFKRSEAATFADIARQQGVPASSIALEPNASNTAENIRFSFALLGNHLGFGNGQDVLLVCRNIYRPRVAATLRRWQPQQAFYLSSPELTYAEFAPNPAAQAQARHAMVGEIGRLLHYPARGWLPPVLVPEPVLAAYETLCCQGYGA